MGCGGHHVNIRRHESPAAVPAAAAPAAAAAWPPRGTFITLRSHCSCNQTGPRPLQSDKQAQLGIAGRCEAPLGWRARSQDGIDALIRQQERLRSARARSERLDAVDRLPPSAVSRGPRDDDRVI